MGKLAGGHRIRRELLLGFLVARRNRLHGNCEIALHALPGILDWDGRMRSARQHSDFVERADFSYGSNDQKINMSALLSKHVDSGQKRPLSGPWLPMGAVEH